MKYILISILFFSVSAFSIQKVKLSKGAVKRMDKVVKSTWDIESYSRTPLDLSGLEEFKLDGSEELFLVKDTEGNKFGYLVLSSARGKYDLFDLMVLYDQDLKIKNSAVLVYREDFGGEIGSSRWLRQFIGKNILSEFKLDNDVQGISGATISVRSATREFKRLTAMMNQLKEQNILTI